MSVITHSAFYGIVISNSKGKVFYGQEPLSGEFTTTERGVNYQLLTVMLPR